MLVRCDVLLYKSLEYAVLAVQAEDGSYTMSGEPSVSSASIACRYRTIDRDVDQGDRRAPEGRGESCDGRRVQFVVAEDWRSVSPRTSETRADLLAWARGLR